MRKSGKIRRDYLGWIGHHIYSLYGLLKVLRRFGSLYGAAASQSLVGLLKIKREVYGITDSDFDSALSVITSLAQAGSSSNKSTPCNKSHNKAAAKQSEIKK